MLGLLNLKSGSVVIDGKDISKLSPQDRVKGFFVPKQKMFLGMTVEENLEMHSLRMKFRTLLKNHMNFSDFKRKKSNGWRTFRGQRQQVALVEL